MGDDVQLRLIQESIFNPQAEEEAKKILLKEIYNDILKAGKKRAQNGGELAPIPRCIHEGRICDDDKLFTYNAIRLMLSRYISKDEYGRALESPSMVMKRVALGLSKYVDSDRLYRLLVEGKFIFNSPTLFNMYADGARGALSACYVTPVYDDMMSIMDASVVQAMTFKYGGGQGFSFSNLRPRWSPVRGTGAYSSGPLSFMKIYDAVTASVKQGGKRRGANMGILHDWHPDIYNPDFDPFRAFIHHIPVPARKLLQKLRMLVDEIEKDGYRVNDTVKSLLELFTSETHDPDEAGFIQAKRGPLGDVNLTNFNISVGVHDAFMQAVLEGRNWRMISPPLSEAISNGDYKIHYSVSKATGMGRLGELIDKIETPYLSILEDEIERAIEKAESILREAGFDPQRRNPYAWEYPARTIWQEIILGAWESGDPGIFFLDNHNKWNPTPWLGVVVATNPCVGKNTLILTPEGLSRAESLYRHAMLGRVGGSIAGVVADAYVLGEGGEAVGYTTQLKAPIQLGDGLALINSNSIVWHIGRKKGYKITLETGHEIIVTKEHRLLAWSKERGEYEYIPASRIARERGVYLIPIYMMTFARTDWQSKKGIKWKGVEQIASLLLSDFKLENGNIKLTPLAPEISHLIEHAFTEYGKTECQIRKEGDTIIVDGYCLTLNNELLQDMLRDPYSLVEKTPLLSLAEAGYYIGAGLHSGVTLTEKLRERIPILAVILQLAGWVLRIEDGKVYTVRHREPVYLARVVGVEEVEDDFYDFTVPGYHAYIGNGIVHHNCGEQPLYPFESCNLGSLSIDKYVALGTFNVEAFYRDVMVAVEAMDAIIDANKHPDPRQDRVNRFTRKIGLGIMGLAEALARLKIPYDSEEGVAFTLIVMASLEVFAWKRSWELGAKKGPAPAFKCLVYDWRTQKCIKKERPERLMEMHTPALLKASMVRRIMGDWLIVKYHDVRIPQEILARLSDSVRDRVSRDGTVRLVKWSAVEEVLSRVFGVTRRHYVEAMDMDPLEIADSPRHLLALAVYDPALAWEKITAYGRALGAVAPRNTVVTTIAPTGSISILAGTSSGIEPFFALVYTRRVSVGEFLEVVRSFRNRLLRAVREHRMPEKVVETILETIKNRKGSLRAALSDLEAVLVNKGAPVLVMEKNDTASLVDLMRELEELARIYPTALDVDIWYHLAHQAAAQLYVDQSISKTVNLPSKATPNDVETVYLTAWLLGFKGVTVYRDESKSQQVIYFGPESREEPVLMRPVKPRYRALRLPIAKRGHNPEMDDISGQVVVGEEDNSTCSSCSL